MPLSIVENDEGARYLFLGKSAGAEGFRARTIALDGSGEALIPLDRLRRTRSAPATGNDLAAAIGALDWNANGDAGMRFRAQAQFLPYQFRPLMKFLTTGNRRILIADETGLGKTVEAGYILAQAVGERSASRILVVCPPRLRFKWAAELRTRFGLRLQELNVDGLRRYVAGDQPFLGIVSSDVGDAPLIQQLQASQGSPLDLVIIDEIHGMIGRGAETLRRQLGMVLAAAAREVVGISATPVNLEIDDLRRIFEVIKAGEIDSNWFEAALKQAIAANRLSKALGAANWDHARRAEFDRLATALIDAAETLGLPTETVAAVRRARDGTGASEPANRADVRRALSRLGFAPIMTRTRSVEVGQQRKRYVKTIRVTLDQQPLKVIRNGASIEISEAQLYARVDQFLSANLYHAHRLQLSSCLPAMVGLLRRGAAGLTTWSLEDRTLSPARQLAEPERKNAEVLANLFDLLPADSKWNITVELLRDLARTAPMSKVLVFTHWRPTFDHLVRKASTARDLKFFIASPDNDDRTTGRTIAQFRTHEGFAVLLTTDILREGVDLQVAGTVINYDLPYNPQVLEQRIGRIDRLGQTSPDLRIYNILVAASLDEKIHSVILSRSGAFEHAVGEMKPIVEEMSRALAERGTIDDHLAVRLVNATKAREEILNHPALSIPEEFLDAEIRAARKQSTQGPQRFRIVSLAWFLQQLAPSANIQLDVPAQSLRITNPEPAYTMSWVNATPLEDREDTAADLERLTRNGQLELSIGALPDAHPLLRVAGKAAALRFTVSGSPECPTIQAASTILEGAEHVCLFQCRYKGKNLSRSEWNWIAVDHNGQARQLSGTAAETLLGTINAAPRIERSTPPQAVIDAAQLMASEWGDRTTRAEAAAIIADYDRRLSYLRFLQRQTKIAAAEDDAVGPLRKPPATTADVEELGLRLAHLRTPAAFRELEPTITARPVVLWRKRDLG